MTWPIPDIPEQKSLPRPKYRFWLIILILMLSMGVFSGLWLWNVTTYIEVLFYGVLPALFFWFCFLGIILNRYEQSVAASLSWCIEAEQTKAEWKMWSRRQLAVIGNVLFSPEEKGMEALLGELEAVPAYPKKARPLFSSPHNFLALMKETDQKLELQYPGYRHVLHAISILQSPGGYEEKNNESIIQQWNLIPTSLYSIDSIQSLYDSTDLDGLMLIICLQDWSTQSGRQSSEFISAQLITSPSFARQHGIPVIAGLTRMMPLEPGNMINELKMLFEYNQPDKQNLEYIWLSGTAEKTATDIMLYAAQHQWLLPEKRPLHSIDFSFGPPGEMALPLSFAMLTEAAHKTGKDQLLIHQTPQQTGTLCLITRELYT